MMKWKVVKNSRCVSADRSLECLRNKDFLASGSDSNNNQCKPEASNQNENNKQQDQGFIRKPSLGTSECMNLKSFLGLSRQRSEINLSNLGLTGHESRRSRSEVRGISCDRLTIGYHTPSIEPAKPPNTGPVSKPGGWLRGRKKEREIRNSSKNNAETNGKTVVTGTKRASSKESRTVVDQTCGVLLKNVTKLSPDGPKSNRNLGEDLVDEDIYAEIGQLKVSEVKAKVPSKPSRKKCQAPKPQIPGAHLKETNCDVNLNPNGQDDNVTTNCFIEKKMSPLIKPARKLHPVNTRDEDRYFDNRTAPAVKLNNLKNSETFLTVKNKINSDVNTYVTVAEIHKNTDGDYISESKNYFDDVANDQVNEYKNQSDQSNQKREITSQEKLIEELKVDETLEELPSYHIDTPDYSTLESVVDSNKNSSELTPMNILKNKTSSLTDLINCITLNYSSTEKENSQLQGTISSILRDSSNDLDSAPKKVVRFEKLDLIEKYKKNKAENAKDSDEESVLPNSENKQSTDMILDVNSNEIMPRLETEKIIIDSTKTSESVLSDKLSCSSSDCFSESSATSSTESECPQKSMTVNVLVRNSSTECNINGESQTDETQTQLIVKKSFVLTVAKQERGFKSLCANKKPEITTVEPSKTNHKISVTILCSETLQEITKNETPMNEVRLRSLSVPPQILQKSEKIPEVLPVVRGRSRERRPKERHHYKKNHKSKKKDSSHHMPQAVIDELAQVLEKRKPSLDKKTAPRSS